MSLTNTLTDIVTGIAGAMWVIFLDAAPYLFLGFGVAGLLHIFIPDEKIMAYLGGGLASMLIMLVVGIPLYICATASTPIAAALIAKGMSPGTAFVFLLAGPATNAVTITMVARFLGKRSVVLYLAVIVLCSIAFGLALDIVYHGMGIATTSIAGSMCEVLPHEVKMIFAVLMLPMMAYATYRSMRTIHLYYSASVFCNFYIIPLYYCSI